MNSRNMNKWIWKIMEYSDWLVSYLQVVSTVAVIASVITLPMLYGYVQSFQSHLMVETDYCKVGFSIPQIAL